MCQGESVGVGVGVLVAFITGPYKEMLSHVSMSNMIPSPNIYCETFLILWKQGINIFNRAPCVMNIYNSKPGYYKTKA